MRNIYMPYGCKLFSWPHTPVVRYAWVSTKQWMVQITSGESVPLINFTKLRTVFQYCLYFSLRVLADDHLSSHCSVLCLFKKYISRLMASAFGFIFGHSKDFCVHHSNRTADRLPRASVILLAYIQRLDTESRHILFVDSETACRGMLAH